MFKAVEELIEYFDTYYVRLFLYTIWYLFLFLLAISGLVLFLAANFGLGYLLFGQPLSGAAFMVVEAVIGFAYLLALDRA